MFAHPQNPSSLYIHHLPCVVNTPLPHDVVHAASRQVSKIVGGDDTTVECTPIGIWSEFPFLLIGVVQGKGKIYCKCMKSQNQMVYIVIGIGDGVGRWTIWRRIRTQGLDSVVCAIVAVMTTKRLAAVASRKSSSSVIFWDAFCLIFFAASTIVSTGKAPFRSDVSWLLVRSPEAESTG